MFLLLFHFQLLLFLLLSCIVLVGILNQQRKRIKQLKVILEKRCLNKLKVDLPLKKSDTVWYSNLINIKGLGEYV